MESWLVKGDEESNAVSATKLDSRITHVGKGACSFSDRWTVVPCHGGEKVCRVRSHWAGEKLRRCR